MSSPGALAAAAVLLLGSCAAPLSQDFRRPGPYPPPRTTQFTGHFGERHFEDERWAPLETQLVGGLTIAEPVDGPFWVETGSQFSYDSSTVEIGGTVEGVRSTTWDFYLGALVQPHFNGWRLRPYGGLGFAMRSIDLEEEFLGMLSRDSDITLGGYGKLGCRLDIYPGGFIGVEVRAFEGERARLHGTELDTSSYQILFVSGSCM